MGSSSGFLQNMLNTGGNVISDGIKAIGDVLSANAAAKGQSQAANALASAEAAKQAGNTQIAMAVLLGVLAIAGAYVLARR